MSAILPRRTADALVGLGLAALGGWFAWSAGTLPPSDEPGVPGPGTLPFILAIGVMFCGFAIVLLALVRSNASDVQFGGRKHAIALFSLLAGLVLFEPAGFMLSTFLFLSCGFLFLAGARWSRAIPSAALASVVLWLVFAKLLGVGLPYGLIGEILFR